MKKPGIVLFLFASIIFFGSCRKIVGEGPTVTENRAIGNFTSVASSISADVFYKQAPQLSIELTAQQNILDIIETHVVNNELRIGFKNNVQVSRHENIIVKISSPVITGLRLSGSGNLVADSLNGDNISFSLSGSGNINAGKLTVTFLDASISGSGDISILDGAVNTGKLKISGSGDIDMRNVAAVNVSTTTSGSGKIWVDVSQSLDVSISGSGSVFYRGNPVLDTHISGSGKVIHQ